MRDNEEKKETIRTTDIHLSAYLLALGYSITGLTVTKQLNKDICILTFEGASLEEQRMSYLSNRAKVDPVLYQKAVNRIRDMIFEALDKARAQGSIASDGGAV